MLELEVIERSIMLGYVLGYCYASKVYVVYSCTLSEAATVVINTVLGDSPEACVLIAGTREKAESISHSHEWLKAVDEV